MRRNRGSSKLRSVYAGPLRKTTPHRSSRLADQAGDKPSARSSIEIETHQPTNGTVATSDPSDRVALPRSIPSSVNQSQPALARAVDLRHWPPLGADHRRRSAPIPPAHALCRNSVFKELQPTGRRPSCAQLHQRPSNATQHPRTQQMATIEIAEPTCAFRPLGPRSILSQSLSESGPGGQLFCNVNGLIPDLSAIPPT